MTATQRLEEQRRLAREIENAIAVREEYYELCELVTDLVLEVLAWNEHEFVLEQS